VQFGGQKGAKPPYCCAVGEQAGVYVIFGEGRSMKALLLNSGVGSRLKGLATCKCLVELATGTTILDAQIQSLLNCGITDIYITTGPYADRLEGHVRKNHPDGRFTFINNPLYNQTNYIYSLLLARDYLNDDDLVLMHGDLVFEQNVLLDIVATRKSCVVIDSTQPLPEKDFKAVIRNNRIANIGVEFFTDSCYAQPLYKLKEADWSIWMGAIEDFCQRGKTQVYAENALNSVSHLMGLFPLDISGRTCFEVDNEDDLSNARKAYADMPDRLQEVSAWHGAFDNARSVLSDYKKTFVVCSRRAKSALSSWDSDFVIFDSFAPNPDFVQVLEGIRLFEKENCDFIMSFGGGSSIDVAKSVNILEDGETVKLLDMPRAGHLSIPTTAGSGSEATRFAVLYDKGQKLSVEHESILPEQVILDPNLLQSLPIYHKKSSLLDALCQAIESLWAKGGTPKSRSYARGAIRAIREEVDDYLANEHDSALRILQGANLSGKAINISKTTAAHAMSYGLTTLFGLAHGQSVALCLPLVWEHLLKYDDPVIPDISLSEYKDLLKKLDMFHDLALTGAPSDGLIKELLKMINPQRLGNHPVTISEGELADMYRQRLSPL
jgi:alcohol dehydrogenase class IV/choline kinase